MEDKQIVNLFWERSESAISETQRKYGKYCYFIAHNILYNIEDSEECVNDTYMRAWNSMPQQRPSVLKTFLGKITRNLALNKYKALSANAADCIGCAGCEERCPFKVNVVERMREAAAIFA